MISGRKMISVAALMQMMFAREAAGSITKLSPIPFYSGIKSMPSEWRPTHKKDRQGKRFRSLKARSNKRKTARKK